MALKMYFLGKTWSDAITLDAQATSGKELYCVTCELGSLDNHHDLHGFIMQNCTQDHPSDGGSEVALGMQDVSLMRDALRSSSLSKGTQTPGANSMDRESACIELIKIMADFLAIDDGKLRTVSCRMEEVEVECEWLKKLESVK